MHRINFNEKKDMNEFIFGDLAIPQFRMEYLRTRHKGINHNHQLTPMVPKPGQRPKVSVKIDLPFAIKRVECRILEPEQTVVPLEIADVEWDTLDWRYTRQWEGFLPGYGDGVLVRYQIIAYTEKGNESIPADQGAIFSYLVGRKNSPDWTADAIIYQIFLDRFHPGKGKDWNNATKLNDIFGGTIRGVIDNLDYIIDLGFNCVLLNPFFPDDSHHGYHATEHFSVNSRLGSIDELREFVDLAHARGLKIIMDFVANHWSCKHHTFQEAQKSSDSPYRDWYYWIDWPHDYHTFFGVMELPKVNVDHKEVRAHLLEVARFWTDFGFDGFRLDYAIGPSHDFWTDFRLAIKEINPNAWIFGEIVGPPSSMLSYYGRFDGCLDFIRLQAFRDTFAFGTMDIESFDNFLRKHEDFFPENFNLITFLDNHDMNRFLWLTKGDKRKLKLAALCLFTLKGIPIMYYGTEAGVFQERDTVCPDGRHIMEESRMPMLWNEEQDMDLVEYFRGLIQYRKNHSVLRYGKHNTVHVDKNNGTWAYTRSDENETLLVAMNLSDEERTFQAHGKTITLQSLTGNIIEI